MNSARGDWLSKKQAPIETSVFRAECVVMNQGMEAVPGLRISGPTFFYGDNISVIHNT